MSEVLLTTNPFPGLRSFDSQDSHLFFGREKHIHELRKKLNRSGFLAIVGMSGSGKSSLVKAGLIPSLQHEKLDRTDSTDWSVLFFNPSEDPVGKLAATLSRYAAQGERSSAFVGETDLAQRLRTDPDTIGKVLSSVDSNHHLLVIDQFEEIFRYHQSQSDTDPAYNDISIFINLILKASRRQPQRVYIVLTMRSDYLDECSNYEGLTEAINLGYYLLPKMNPEEIRQVITMPIEMAGADITDRLTNRLLTEVGSNHNRLPVLQHALMRTWSYWQHNNTPDLPIDIGHYEATGTMAKALSIHAEEIYSDLPNEKSRIATEKLFKALVMLGPNDTGKVQPAPLKDIQKVTGIPEYQLIDVVDRFRESGASFLSPPFKSGLNSNSIIDITLEDLTMLWDRLHTWVEEETEAAKLYKELAYSAQQYHEGKTGLWVNPELQIGLRWLRDNRPTPEWAKRYDSSFERAIEYLDYSKKQHDFEVQNTEDRQKRELRRARYAAVLMGAGSLLSMLFLFVSITLWKQAKQSEKEALEKEKLALAERIRAEVQTREAISQKKIAEQQEVIAEQQKKLTEEQTVIALREQQQADEKRREAEQARQLAESQTVRAENARKEAVLSKNEAENQRSKAELARLDAESSRREAVVAQSEAEKQRGKAIARSLAIQSYQMPDNIQDGLPALLAIQAYNFNLKNGGRRDNPEVFNALSKVANAKVTLRRHNDVVRALSVMPGPNATTFASASDDATIRIWNYKSPNQAPITLAATGKKPSGYRTLLFTKDGKSLFAANDKGQIFRWNLATPALPPTAVQAHKNPVHSLLWQNDKAHLVSVSPEGAIRTWKVGDTRIDSLQHINAQTSLYCAQITPDGNYLACGTANDKVIFFDLSNLKKPPVSYTFNGLGGRVSALAFSPDGQKLITGSSTGALYAWNLQNNRPSGNAIALTGRHSSTVNHIRFSPNGEMMASCSYDWSVHLWNYEELLSQQQQPVSIKDFDSWVLDVNFTNDNKQLIVCGADRTVRIWNIDPAELYNRVLAKATRNLTPDEWNQFIGKEISYERVRPDTE